MTEFQFDCFLSALFIGGCICASLAMRIEYLEDESPKGLSDVEFLSQTNRRD
jgi:hypothetical protein